MLWFFRVPPANNAGGFFGLTFYYNRQCKAKIQTFHTISRRKNMGTVYTATLNDRFIFKSATIDGIKRSASRQANKTFKTLDRMVVTGRKGEEFLGRFVFERTNPSYDARGSWVCVA